MHDTRAAQRALVARLGEAVVGAAAVAHGGEASVEHAAQDGNGARVQKAGRHSARHAQVGAARRDVHVAVDEPGHQRQIAAIEVLWTFKGL